jgi:hypothetical protein
MILKITAFAELNSIISYSSIILKYTNVTHKNYVEIKHKII